MQVTRLSEKPAKWCDNSTCLQRGRTCSMARVRTRKGLVRALDKVMSLLIRARDEKCQTCGSRENLQNGHLFSRSNHAARWNFINCHTQCGACNIRHEHDPYIYTEWFRKRYGQSVYHALHKAWAQTSHFSDLELKHKPAKLEAIYDLYKLTGDKSVIPQPNTVQEGCIWPPLIRFCCLYMRDVSIGLTLVVLLWYTNISPAITCGKL